MPSIECCGANNILFKRTSAILSQFSYSPFCKEVVNNLTSFAWLVLLVMSIINPFSIFKYLCKNKGVNRSLLEDLHIIFTNLRG